MNVIAIMKLNSDGAVTVQHIPADGMIAEYEAARVEDAKQIDALIAERDALKDVLKEISLLAPERAEANIIRAQEIARNVLK